MQLFGRAAVAAAALSAVPLAGAIKFFEDVAANQSPVYKATELVANLEADLVSDGKVEQQSYDKYMCWCEDTMNRKTQDMSDARSSLFKLAKQIPKLGAEVASHGAEVGQVEKDIKANEEAQREASQIRASEAEAFEAAKAESETSIGALEAAITALTGAGAKKGFLETIKQAQLISVAAGVKQVLLRDSTASRASSQDMETLRRFVEQPGDFFGGDAERKASAALQVVAGQRSNPFGDYAPQSTQIQGILKGLYDGFMADMEKDHGAEADRQKAFEELMATKARELADLKATLQQHTGDKAQKAKLLADSKVERDDTEAQLKADEAFFEETKDGCQKKSQEWSVRTRLRTQELLGIGAALKILRDPENQAIFNRADATFVQLSSNTESAGSSVAASAQSQQQKQQQHRALAALRASRAFGTLSALAGRLDSLSLARIAAMAKVGGHFDQVMTAIDGRVADLRKEAQEDIEHRDRCQSAQTKNGNDIEDLKHAEDKATDALDRLDGGIRDAEAKVSDLKTEIQQTDTQLMQILEMRNAEVEEFKTALKDDTMAVEILKSAISAMAKFYKDNQAAVALLQETPVYSVDADKAPDTSYDGSKPYAGGRAAQSGGALGALEMVVEDIQKEMGVAKADDAKSEARYEEAKADLLAIREKAEKAKAEVEGKAAELKEKKEDKEEHKAEVLAELDTEYGLKATIKTDCAWVKKHFETRRTKRKAEIDGLQEAKSMLAGAENGDYDELVISSGAE